MAEANIAGAGLSDVVKIIVGPAAETLPKLVAENGPGFDFVFIDADKASTTEYFAWSLRLSHVGTLIVVDNVVRGGKLADLSNDDPSVRGMQRFVDSLASEPRVKRHSSPDRGLQRPRRIRPRPCHGLEPLTQVLAPCQRAAHDPRDIA